MVRRPLHSGDMLLVLRFLGIFVISSGKGADVIFDCVGSSFWEQNIRSLALDGRWVLYGLLGGGNVSGNLEIC